jgi:hypothetical protein
MHLAANVVNQPPALVCALLVDEKPMQSPQRVPRGHKGESCILYCKPG